MAIYEIITNSLGAFQGLEMYEFTGCTGKSYGDSGVWLAQKAMAGITNITCVSHKVAVVNNGGLGWVVFDEPTPDGVIRNFFVIK